MQQENFGALGRDLGNNRNELIDRLDIIDNNIRNVREIGEQNQRSIRELHESVRGLDEKMIVRVSNSNNIVETALIYYIRENEIPDHFPKTVGELNGCNRNMLTEMLLFYGLPVPRTKADKLRSIKIFLGLPRV